MIPKPLASAALLALTCAGLSSSASAQRLEPVLVATAAGRPTSIAFAPGVTDQYYVAEKTGRIWVMRDGTYLQTPFMDLRPLVNDTGEGGLLGMAFDPDFQANGYFYLSYTVGDNAGDSVVARYSIQSGSLEVGDPGSAEVLFGPLVQSTDRHKGGDLGFGPDGMLYFSLGDGVQALEAQDLASPRGKIHRFDPDLPFPHAPADNPFVGTAGAVPTVWAYGFRNPWRFDIDPDTGDLYVGDVGEGALEEITRLEGAMGGANAGWPCKEGSACFAGGLCDCNDPSFVDPIAELTHAAPDSACSITGGVIYRGSAIPSLAGQYVFTDFCSGSYYRVEDPSGAAPGVVDVSADVQAGGMPIRFVVEFARDAEGEIYFVTHYGAEIFKLVPRAGFETYCESAPNSSGSAAVLTPSGSASIAAANLTLSVGQLPTNALGYFILSQARADVPGFGGSQGVLCVGQPIARWSAIVLQSGAAGQVSLTTDLTDLPPTVIPTAGATWNFQYWTRDANPAATSNTSNAAAVTFAL